MAGLQEAMLFDGWALDHVCFASEIVPYCLECDVRVVFGNGRHTAVRLPSGSLLAPTEGTDIFEKGRIQQEHGCLYRYITLCMYPIVLQDSIVQQVIGNCSSTSLQDFAAGDHVLQVAI